jgi:hypothetical protein
MIVEAPWFVPNMIIRRDLQTPAVKEEISVEYSHQRTPKHPSSEPHGATTTTTTTTTGDYEDHAK